MRADEVLAQVPTDAWQRRSAGAGAQGERWYDWVRVRLGRWPEPGWEHCVLARRSASNPAELAYDACLAPGGTLLETVIAVAARRWTVKECFEQAKGEVGLDHYEIRHWVGWYRHMTLVMLALAYLAVLRARLGHEAETRGTRPSRSCRWPSPKCAVWCIASCGDLSHWLLPFSPSQLGDDDTKPVPSNPIITVTNCGCSINSSSYRMKECTHPVRSATA